jgi:hypothetical protein
MRETILMPRKVSERYRIETLLCIGVVSLAASLLTAGGVAAAGEGYMPDRAAVSALAATKGHATGTGLDINASSLLTNAGINVLSWNGSDRNGTAKYDLGLYLGVGLANIIQFQAGHTSETGFTLRIRSGIPLTLTEPSWARFNEGKYWTVTPLVEIPLTRHHGTVFGVGLGWTF